MTRQGKQKVSSQHSASPPARETRFPLWGLLAIAAVVLALLYYILDKPQIERRPVTATQQASPQRLDNWIDRAGAVTTLFHKVYTPCWEGAYGAIGDAYLFRATGDST